MSPSDGPRPAKPETVFDRDAEWNALVAFSCDTRPGAGLGVVSGRLRQGKTYLLEALTGALGGFYFGAQPAAEAESLRRLGDELAQFTGASPPAHRQSWEEAVDALLSLGDGRVLPVVIDEFPDLVRQSPSLPSVIQRALRRLRATGRENRSRLVLSGSALPVMRRLFGTASPLHELADLELTVRPLDFRQAARFWGIDDPRLAVLVHAVVGGTPAYRRDYVGGDAPGGPDDFDAWVCRTVLNPRTPLFREAHQLLQEETDHWDRALFHSALAAVALGCSTHGEVAECLGAQLTDASRCLALLRESGLLHGEPDAFRPHVTRLHIAEPLLAFEHAVIWPHRSALDRQDAADTWRRARPAFDSTVVGPHFAQICRDWAMDFAGPETFGGRPAVASHGSLPHPAHQSGLEAEVVVRGRLGSRSGALMSVGLARWNEVMDLPHLERLRQLLALLAARGEDVGHVRPACYGGMGFTPALRRAEADGDVVLVGPDRLYEGR
ncbi:ArsR family transcriptional regulator [Streptomyces sp. GC420]|uniref:AAA family ATPase n=1 Tax=Streptomyces sp. GC420 TaxID=2697568 RepID=UPI0028BE6144|nr:ArsR family transcriptional regulator [Streptomyces sp. GC420]